MKKLLKNEKGSVSLYALIAMLILMVVLLNVYIFNTQKQSRNLEITKQIKTTYEKDINNVNNVYNNLIAQ